MPIQLNYQPVTREKPLPLGVWALGVGVLVVGGYVQSHKDIAPPVQSLAAVSLRPSFCGTEIMQQVHRPDVRRVHFHMLADVLSDACRDLSRSRYGSQEWNEAVIVLELTGRRWAELEAMKN